MVPSQVQHKALQVRVHNSVCDLIHFPQPLNPITENLYREGGKVVNVDNIHSNINRKKNKCIVQWEDVRLWTVGCKKVSLLSSRLAARPNESKWSPGGGSVSNSSLAHELWKVPLTPKGLAVAAPSRPPPGLTSQKPSSASSGWDGSALRLGGWSTAESRYTPGENRWRRVYPVLSE